MTGVECWDALLTPVPPRDVKLQARRYAAAMMVHDVYCTIIRSPKMLHDLIAQVPAAIFGAKG